MAVQLGYLDELLHDTWISLPPLTIEGDVVLQCHRDRGGKRHYFRVALTQSAIEGWSDPDQSKSMTIMGVAVSNKLLCFEGIEGGELRVQPPTSIRHKDEGWLPRNRSWSDLRSFRLPGQSAAPLASDFVVVDGLAAEGGADLD